MKINITIEEIIAERLMQISHKDCEESYCFFYELEELIKDFKGTLTLEQQQDFDLISSVYSDYKSARTYEIVKFALNSFKDFLK